MVSNERLDFPIRANYERFSNKGQQKNDIVTVGIVELFFHTDGTFFLKSARVHLRVSGIVIYIRRTLFYIIRVANLIRNVNVRNKCTHQLFEKGVSERRSRWLTISRWFAIVYYRSTRNGRCITFTPRLYNQRNAYLWHESHENDIWRELSWNTSGVTFPPPPTPPPASFVPFPVRRLRDQRVAQIIEATLLRSLPRFILFLLSTIYTISGECYNTVTVWRKMKSSFSEKKKVDSHKY